MNLNGQAFMMLKLKECKPKLNEMIGPVELSYTSYSERSREEALCFIREERKLKEVAGMLAGQNKELTIQTALSTITGTLPIRETVELCKSENEKDVDIKDVKLEEYKEAPPTRVLSGGSMLFRVSHSAVKNSLTKVTSSS